MSEMRKQIEETDLTHGNQSVDCVNPVCPGILMSYKIDRYK